MRNYLLQSLIVIILAPFLNINAQKLDKESLGVYKFIQLPINPVLSEFHTYKVEGIGQYSDAYRRDAIVAAAYLAGYEKINSPNAELKVKIEEYPILFDDVKPLTKTEKYKANGVEKTRTLYYYFQAYKFKYVMTIYNKSDEILFEYNLTGEERIYGPDRTTDKSAFEHFETAKNRSLQEVIHVQVAKLCDMVNNQVGFPVKSFPVQTATVKAKKYDYEDYFKAFGQFKKGVDVIIKDEDNITEATAFFDEANVIFDNLLNEADINNKKARINKNVAMVCYLNKALGYLLMKDYNNAIECFEKGRELDKKYASMDSGWELAQSRLERLKANN